MVLLFRGTLNDYYMRLSCAPINFQGESSLKIVRYSPNVIAYKSACVMYINSISPKSIEAPISLDCILLKMLNVIHNHNIIANLNYVRFDERYATGLCV